MLISSLPIAIAMQRRKLAHKWVDEVWEPLGVTPDPGGLHPVRALGSTPQGEAWLHSGHVLELHRDEDEGYFENWVAPEPKVFVMWRVIEGHAVPVLASVSYVEGTRMMDSGEQAGGVPMPPEVHAWLGDYLRTHYKPRPRGRKHHG